MIATLFCRVGQLATSQSQSIKNMSLNVWAESFPDSLKPKVASLAPLLDKLGYDPTEFPPDYAHFNDVMEQYKEKMKNLVRLNESGLIDQPKIRPVLKDNAKTPFVRPINGSRDGPVEVVIHV